MTKSKNIVTLDGNTACAKIAYKCSEIAPIYPITPSSTMAEVCDSWACSGEKNVFNQILEIVEMQSEAGAAGALHGALRAGTLGTTFTASQGLLLMIPDMYKIAGELLPCVIHVTARAVATHALSIFGDHSDVMATRQTGFSMLCSSSVQQAHDFALIAHSATLKSSVPFVHFFDGFRTSHELNEVNLLDDETIRKMIDQDDINAFKLKAMQNIDAKMYGTSQSADVYFANREKCNSFYKNVTHIVEKKFAELHQLTGREYHIFDYYGAEDAEYVAVCMGSGVSVLKEVCEHLNKKGEKIGVLAVRLFRPFDAEFFLSKLPKSVKKIAVLDRTKESGSVGEPLFLDVCAVVSQAKMNVEIVGGRYGLGSFEFNPAMAKAVFDNLKRKDSKNHFTIGINDDVTNLSLDFDSNFHLEDNNYNCVFYGIGGDGTISANKNSAKILGKSGFYSQAYFVYDSKKSGSMTVSHLRFGKNQIDQPYLIENADFLAVHNFSLVSKVDVLQNLKQNGTILLNCPFDLQDLENFLSENFVEKLRAKNAKFFVIDALNIAKSLGLKNKINVIMQGAFFYLANILPFEQCKKEMAEMVRKSYAKFGEEVVEANIKAIDFSSNVLSVDYSKLQGKKADRKVLKIENKFYDEIMQPIEKLRGKDIAVSKFSVDGSMPVGTSQFEKRGIATDLPKWHKENCIECNLCSLVCPHSAIRAKETSDDCGAESKDTLLKGRGKFCLAVSPLDCTGCGNCVDICPARQKALSMEKAEDLLEKLNENYEKFKNVKPLENTNRFSLKNSQFEKPLLEFNGACAGCGQTAYVKLLTQLCGESLLIANATGCSSIWGGSYPSCPYTKSNSGLGVAWANSLFEDNAEFGLGIKLATNVKRLKLVQVWAKLAENNVELQKLYEKWLENSDNFDVCKQIYFELLEILKSKHKCKTTKEFISLLDVVMPKDVWIVGGDGWAYDIGYGGLDHILASGENVNILVLDTEVYSNTGGQSSKATPLGAVAKFAQGGKKTQKKNLAKIAMQYDDVYVAKICLAANPNQALTAFKEAMEHKGPSLIIAYAPCTTQGIDMSKTPTIEKMAVQSGYFTLLRRKPMKQKSLLEKAQENMKNPNFANATSTTAIPDGVSANDKQQNKPELGRTENYDVFTSGELIIDSGNPTIPLEDFLSLQNRFKRKEK